MFAKHKIQRDAFNLYLVEYAGKVATNEKDMTSLVKNVEEYINLKISDSSVKHVNVLLNSMLIATIDFPQGHLTPLNSQIHSNIKTYIVKTGDSLWKIATKNNMSITELKTLNSLTEDTIYPGEELKVTIKTINEPSANEVLNYSVKADDTLLRIAQDFDMTVRELKRINNLSTEIIYVGQTLKVIPGPQTPIGQTTYTVESGDTLKGISKKLNRSVAELKTVNQLKTDKVYSGQVLMVPNINSTNLTYKVNDSDTLPKIAKQFQITEEELRELNQLNSNFIFSGQSLKVKTNFNSTNY